ncbi:MAG: DUF3307 domain-containing protein [Dysgonamonadaceae bacterium]|nr:DUF3307 domain-containing protein [Dysgonamonadaceae bacterium]MDD4605384.1 DUF3307 domain-containing protein [Dysgonamonadaceae bacterium]
MIILVKLILAHLAGDFLLQSKSWVIDKEANKAKSIKLYLHTLLHGVLVILVLWNINYWLIALILMFTHLIVDSLKIYLQKENTKTRWFIIDQLLHLLSIVVVWLIFFRPDLNLNFWMNNDYLWIFVTSLLFITYVSNIIIQVLLSNWSQALNTSSDESLSKAGKYIGILERLFVFTFILTSHWEAIGFLLAAKSVFRFGDLKESKDRKLTEYVLIGTFLSFGIAIGVGLLVVRWINN